MEQTLFAILTNDEARDRKAIERSLDKELVAGFPWFSCSMNLEDVEPYPAK